VETTDLFCCLLHKMYAHACHPSVLLALTLFFTTGQAGEYHDEPEKVFSFKSVRSPPIAWANERG